MDKKPNAWQYISPYQSTSHPGQRLLCDRLVTALINEQKDCEGVNHSQEFTSYVT